MRVETTGSNRQPPGCKQGDRNNCKPFNGNSLTPLVPLQEFSRFYQDFPGIRRFPHSVAAVPEFYASMRYIESVPITSVTISYTADQDEPLSRPRAQQTGRAPLKLSC